MARASARLGRRQAAIDTTATASTIGHGITGGVGAEDHARTGDAVATGSSAWASSAGCAATGVPQSIAASTSAVTRTKPRNIGAILAWIQGYSLTGAA